jgi:hypothetical protein
VSRSKLIASIAEGLRYLAESSEDVTKWADFDAKNIGSILDTKVYLVLTINVMSGIIDR